MGRGAAARREHPRGGLVQPGGCHVITLRHISRRRRPASSAAADLAAADHLAVHGQLDGVGGGGRRGAGALWRHAELRAVATWHAPATAAWQVGCALSGHCMVPRSNPLLYQAAPRFFCMHGALDSSQLELKYPLRINCCAAAQGGYPLTRGLEQPGPSCLAVQPWRVSSTAPAPSPPPGWRPACCAC
jgi:hypothetical protein